MSSGGLQRIEMEASAAGFNKINMKGHVQWVCTCKKCGDEHRATWDIRTSPDLMIKNMRTKGWDVGAGRDPVCPKCRGGRKSMSQLKNGAAISAVPDPPAAMPTLPSAQLSRKVFASLEENFDEQTKRYRSGWSDARVAKETGASETFVASTRRAAFGELAEDPAVTSLKEDIDLKGMEIDQTIADLVKHKEELAALRLRVDKLGGKL